MEEKRAELRIKGGYELIMYSKDIDLISIKEISLNGIGIVVKSKVEEGKIYNIGLCLSPIIERFEIKAKILWNRIRIDGNYDIGLRLTAIDINNFKVLKSILDLSTDRTILWKKKEI